MNDTQHTRSLREKILKEIQSGEVTMTPRAYFTLKIVALLALAIGILLVSIFIFNFLYFSIHASSHDALLGFGPRGFQAFIWLFPWDLFLVDVVLVVLLLWLLRRFRSGYKVPTLYLLVALLVCSALFGFALEQTSFNDRFGERGEGLPPPLSGLYKRAHEAPERGSGICRCKILSIDGNTLLVQDMRDASTTLRILLPDDDERATSTGLQVGDTIFIAGDEDEDNEEIEAFGVRKLQSMQETYEIDVTY